MPPRPLAISDESLKLLLELSYPLSAIDRSSFLEDVARELHGRRCRRPCRAHVPEKISARAEDGGNAERIAVENSWLAPAQRERNRRRRVKNAGVTLRAGAPAPRSPARSCAGGVRALQAIRHCRIMCMPPRMVAEF